MPQENSVFDVTLYDQDVCVTIEGISPLILDPMFPEIEKEIRERLPKLKMPQDVPAAKEAAEKLMIHDGELVIPARYLWQQLKIAGSKIELAKRQRLTNSKNASLLPTFMKIQREFLPLTGPGDWEVDIRSVPTGEGSRIVKVRPRFPKWGVVAHISINSAREDILKRLFAEAGTQCGFGALRPNKGGETYGMWRVVAWEYE